MHSYEALFLQVLLLDLHSQCSARPEHSQIVIQVDNLEQAGALDGQGDVQPKDVDAARRDVGLDGLGQERAVVLQEVSVATRGNTQHTASCCTVAPHK